METTQPKKNKEITAKQVEEKNETSKENEEVRVIREIAKIKEQTFKPQEPISIDQVNNYKF